MKNLPQIKEAIVVEGRDDESAVLKAVDAAVITTHGYGIRKETLELIESAYKKQGIIIFTDPDHAGDQIRKRLVSLFPDAKQAFLTQDEAEKAGDIGIENAAPAAILAALSAARAESRTAQSRYTMADLDRLGLCGRPDSAAARSALGKKIGIGECNAKTFLKRLNTFGIDLNEYIQD